MIQLPNYPKFSLTFQDYNEHCVVMDTKPLSDVESMETDLCLLPGELKCHTFTFLPQAEDVGKILEVSQQWIYL